MKSINIAILFKSTRKFHRLQQTEVANILGVTQGTISKVESASMSPDLNLWFNFLKSFHIQDPYCFTYGAVEFDPSAFLKLPAEGSSLMPTHDFKSGKFLFTVKKIRPLFDFLLIHNEKALTNFLEENRVKIELFYILNHPLTSEFVDRFFTFLNDIKINLKSVGSMDLNFEMTLGKMQKELADIDMQTDLFSLLNADNESIIEYKFDGKKGEYVVNMNKTGHQLITSLDQSEFIMNYNFLYPFYILKSARKASAAASPQIEEVKKEQKWKITYV